MSGKKIPKYSKQDLKIGFALETPTFLLIEALNAIVEILADRGVRIKDWDDRSRTVYKFKWLGVLPRTEERYRQRQRKTVERKMEMNEQHILSLSYGKDCWFCHNQGVQQLRHLRKSYPEYWELMLKWDTDSPVTFKPGSRNSPGHTVHDFDRRFQLEDDGFISPDDRSFRWSDIDEEYLFQLIRLEE